ncbi:MAG: hypothetical protein IJO74_06265 [Clostridia bacterium]|nr:hypothetical protein [Clostridia bacterium]
MLSLLFVIFTTINTQVIKNSVFCSINICMTSFIPSVFIFMILSSYIASCESTSIIFKPLGKVFSCLFGTSECSSLPIILGWITGFPIGASCTYEMYQNGKISKEEAEYLISFCSNSGISFIFGVLGGEIYKNQKTALFLFSIQILASAIVGIIMKEKIFSTNSESQDFPVETNSSYRNLIDCVKKTVINLAYICGYIMFFSALTEFFIFFLPNNMDFIAKGFFELTNACMMLDKIPLKTSLILASGLLSWSGVCVHIQVSTVAPGLSLKKYFTGKLIHMALTMSLTAIVPIKQYINAYKETVTVTYRNNNFGLLFFLIIFAVLCCIFFNNGVKCRK